MFIFCKWVGAAFEALTEDPGGSFLGAPGKNHHLSHWHDWCHMLISGPAAVARDRYYHHWLGPESQGLVLQANRLCREVWEREEN